MNNAVCRHAEYKCPEGKLRLEYVVMVCVDRTAYCRKKIIGHKHLRAYLTMWLKMTTLFIVGS